MFIKKSKSDFIFNNGYLNKLITNKIKSGKKAKSLKIIYSFLCNIHHKIYLKSTVFNFFFFIYINKKKKIKNYLYINELAFLFFFFYMLKKDQKQLKLRKQTLVPHITDVFKKITPIIFINAIKSPNKIKEVEYTPVLKKTKESYIHKSIHFFYKHALKNLKLNKNKNMSTILLEEYLKICTYKSKCFKEKLFYYKVLSINFHKLKFNYKKKY